MEIKPILLSLKHNKIIAFLVVAQVAITLSVLSVSLLMTSTTLKEWNLPSGLEEDQIVSVIPQFYDNSVNVEQSIINDHRRIKEIPGVTHVSTVSQVPFAAVGYSPLYLSPEEGAQEFQTNSFNGDKHIMEVLGLEIIEGRFFYDSEFVVAQRSEIDIEPSVVIISEDMAKALFDEQSAVGKTIWFDANRSMQIVGVYSNFMNGEYMNYFGKSYQTIIRPLTTWSLNNDPKYLIRTEENTALNILEDIQQAIYATNGRYISRNEVLTRTQKRMYDGRSSRAGMLLGISVILLCIAAFGMAGLVSFLVTQRRQQIGTRRALGATKWQVVRYFMTENALLSIIGLSIGVLLSLWFTVLMIEDSGLDILNVSYIFLTALFIFIINQLAVYFPARRAANVAPAIVTRSA